MTRRTHSNIGFDEDLSYRQRRRSGSNIEEHSATEVQTTLCLDPEIVSKWMAKEYGETSQEYYEAYSQEILRSKKTQKDYKPKYNEI